MRVHQCRAAIAFVVGFGACAMPEAGGSTNPNDPTGPTVHSAVAVGEIDATLNLTQFVNPFIGTDDSNSPNPVPGGAGGSTYPGPENGKFPSRRKMFCLRSRKM